MHAAPNVAVEKLNETVATVGEPEPWFIANGAAMRLLGVRTSSYWRLVREKRIIVVGKGRASRASFDSIKRYANELLAQAESQSPTS